MQLNTFSIAACDLDEQAWGSAVASKFLVAGAVVNWARAGVDAVATQAFAKMGYGPDGLEMMAAGKSAQETLAELLAVDSDREQRQVGIVDANGGVAAYTGKECFDWAGHLLVEGFTCQGNILTGAETLAAMAETFKSTIGELADRLAAALRAGDLTSGDRRGKQSAAVVVVRPNGSYGGDTDRYLDLRVDDDPEPVAKLLQLVATHHLLFGDGNPEDLLPIDSELARELQTMLAAQGYYSGEWDTATKEAFRALVGNENLEERWSLDKEPDKIDRVALNYLRNRFGSAH